MHDRGQDIFIIFNIRTSNIQTSGIDSNALLTYPVTPATPLGFYMKYFTGEIIFCQVQKDQE